MVFEALPCQNVVGSGDEAGVIYFCHVQTASSKEEMVRNPDGSLKAYLKVPPVDGKANEALRELLAEEFCVSKSRVKIIRGEWSKNKVVEIC